MLVSTLTRSILIALASASVTATALFTRTGQSQSRVYGARYHVERTILLPGTALSDFLSIDSRHHRLFLSRQDQVQVVDLDRDTVAYVIPNTPGVHGIAVSDDLDRAFTSNSGDTSVSILRLKTLELLGRVKATGAGPDAILYDRRGARVLTFNEFDKNVTVIEPRSLAILGTITLPGSAESAVANNKGVVYVNIKDSGAVAVIDPVAMKIRLMWPISNCSKPHGLALAESDEQLFVACDDEIVSVNASTGRVVDRLHTGVMADQIALDVRRGLLFVPSRGQLYVIPTNRSGHMVVADSVPIQQPFNKVGVDARTGQAFVPTYTVHPASGNAATSNPLLTVTLLVIGNGG
jgi:DNA-binding beta-propeller fold protein YncE